MFQLNVQGSITLSTYLICCPHFHVQVAFRGYSPVKVGGNGRSNGSTLSDTIVHCWLCSTANGSYPLGNFGIITKIIVDN